MGGFYHGSVNSDSYVVLAGGGYKSVSDFLLSHTHAYLPLAGGWMDWTAQINFKGSNGSTSVYSRIGYASGTINGVSMHTTLTNALYICTNGDTSATDNAGLAIDNDGVTVFGAGDAGSVFRVINEDNVSDGAQFYVTKAGGTFSKRGYHHGGMNSDSYVLLAGGGYKALSDFSTTDTNTWRKVLLNGTDKLGTGTGTNPLNIAAGTGISITESNGTFTFNCTVSGSSDVYWKDVKEKIRGGNEFNMVPSGYNNTMWFNYQSDANTTVTVSEYIFGNGSHSATAAIRSGTVYPGANASYNIGKTDSRWDLGYFNSGILIGSTSYTGEHTNAAGTTIKLGYIELSNTNAYIDFHRSGYYTSDYSSRLIHWNNRDRLYYECYSSTYSGYIATCEGNANNLVIIGVFDLYRSNDTTTTWSLSTICGPCSFTLQKSDSVSDVSFKSYTGSVQSWTISSNILRVYVNAPSSSTYAWKSTPYAVSCDARVMTRWINKQPVVTNCLHGEWVGSSIECLCTNIANGGSLYYYSDSPGRYIYITGSRPWGYDDGSNGLGMDMMRVTGNQSYQRIRFTVFGYIS